MNTMLWTGPFIQHRPKLLDWFERVSRLIFRAWNRHAQMFSFWMSMSSIITSRSYIISMIIKQKQSRHFKWPSNFLRLLKNPGWLVSLLLFFANILQTKPDGKFSYLCTFEVNANLKWKCWPNGPLEVLTSRNFQTLNYRLKSIPQCTLHFRSPLY
jgi:hypothetical protein